MKLGKKTWTLKVTETIYKYEKEKKYEIENALKWILKNYKHKESQKEKYIELLNRTFFIDRYFIDEKNKSIKYEDESGVKRIRKGKLGRVCKIPKFHNKKDVCIYANIKALMSGKKQEAVKKVVEKRRLPDGSYKGIDKTTKNTDLKKRAKKISENRRKNNTYQSAQKKTLKQIKKEMEDIAPDYILKSKKYNGNKEKMHFICNNGHSFKMRWNNFVGGQRCPHCNIYKNEEECREILQNITGKKFKKTRPNFLTKPNSNVKLELDGYCEDLKLAFEYDGRQHYEPVDYFGGKEYFDNLQKNDLLKNELCKKHNIKLIRIPYWVENKEKYIREQYDKN